MTIQQQIMANLPNAKLLYFPNYNNSGNQYLTVNSVQVYSGDYQYWASVSTNAGELIVTCDEQNKVDSTIDHFVQSGDKKTVLQYFVTNDIDIQHTDIMRLIQYGEYRTTEKNLCFQHGIYYPMVNGSDDRIPF